MKFKLYKKEFLIAFVGASLAFTLASCGSVPEEKVQETATPIENTEVQTENTEELTQEEKDTAAETAITLMIDSANDLKDSASQSANSEAVQEEWFRALENFKVLSDFIFNGGEINGVTFGKLSDEGKEYAKSALGTLDGILEYLVPNYQERFRNWFTNTTANGLDALSELRDEGVQLWEEIQTKRNRK